MATALEHLLAGEKLLELANGVAAGHRHLADADVDYVSVAIARARAHLSAGHLALALERAGAVGGDTAELVANMSGFFKALHSEG